MFFYIPSGAFPSLYELFNFMLRGFTLFFTTVELLLTGRQRPLQATDVNIQQLGEVWQGFQVTRHPIMIITDCLQSRLVWATFRIKGGEYSSLSSILTCFLATMSDNNSLVRCNFNSCKCSTKTTSDVHLWNILRKENKDKCFAVSEWNSFTEHHRNDIM